MARMNHMLVSSSVSIDGEIEDQKLRYTKLGGLITRYSIEVPSEKVEKLRDFFTNLPSVSSVMVESDVAPKKKVRQ